MSTHWHFAFFFDVEQFDPDDWDLILEEKDERCYELDLDLNIHVMAG